MASLHGIPLLSGPPSIVDTSDSCRKCNKEFNFLFTRSRKCNHCGYLYCHSCSDFQALMPRAGPESGYDPVHVCGYCVELLNMTAAGIGQLRGTSLGKLKSYADSYDISISRAVEKGDIVEAIIRARQNNGCLPQSKEDYYRKNKVPNPHAGARPRSFFSRGNSASDAPPPVPPRTQPQATSGTYRRGGGMDDIPSVPPRYTEPQTTAHNRSGYPPHYEHHSSPYASYHSSRQPHHHPPSSYNTSHHAPPFSQRQPPPPPPPQETRPPPPPRPNTTSAPRPPPRPQATSAPQTPPQRQRTASAPPQPQPSSPPPAVPMPTLDQLLVMTQASIGALPIGVLKNILFTNHVNASMILEKSELVNKVMTLIDDEKRERERQRFVEEAERLEEEERRRERDEAIRKEQEEKRRREEEERLKKERRERQRTRVEDVEDGVDDMMDVEFEISEDEDHSVHQSESGGLSEPSTSATPPPKITTIPQKPITPAIERSGLCVICQDEEANIAIVDCGHLAMCRACSELIMASSRECPLCRTRIVTEARLLRIFKS